MLKLFQVLFFLIYLFLCAGRFTAYIDNNIITWCPWLLWWYCLCRWQSPQKVWCETADVCPERSAHFQGEYTCCSVIYTSTHPPPAVTLNPSSNPAVFQPLWLSACHTRPTHANTSFSVLFQYKELLGRSCLTLRPAAWAGSRPAPTPLNFYTTHSLITMTSCYHVIVSSARTRMHFFTIMMDILLTLYCTDE